MPVWVHYNAITLVLANLFLIIIMIYGGDMSVTTVGRTFDRMTPACIFGVQSTQSYTHRETSRIVSHAFQNLEEVRCTSRRLHTEVFHQGKSEHNRTMRGFLLTRTFVPHKEPGRDRPSDYSTSAPDATDVMSGVRKPIGNSLDLR